MTESIPLFHHEPDHAGSGRHSEPEASSISLTSNGGVTHMRKDEALVALAAHGNVAQFVSFTPAVDGALRVAYSRIDGMAAKPWERI